MPVPPSSPVRALLAAAALLAPAPLLAQAAPNTLRGTVVDSLAGGAPLAGATVQLVRPDQPERARTAVTDAAGAFHLDSLAPGRWVAGFFHPRLDSLGLQVPPRAVEVGAGETTLTLAVPGAATVAAGTCALAPGDSTGLVLARVRDADTGAPLPGSTVRVLWAELVVDGDGLRQSQRAIEGVADEAGRVALCRIPTDVPVIASAMLGGAESGPVELHVPPRGLLHRELRVGRGAAAVVVAPAGDADADAEPFARRRGSARLVGTVRTADGRPVERARVVVHGAAAADTTRADGAFALDALPAGTYTLEARAIGWQPRRMAVDLRSARTDTVRLTLEQPVQALERVTVYGERRSSQDLDGFLRRQQVGMGRYLTPAQLERRNAFDVTDLLRGLPSVRIVRGESVFDQVITLRGCVPTVYLDGRELRGGAATVRDLVRPEELAAVEVYNSPITAPAELFAKNPRCGVIGFWTKWRMGM